MLSYQSGFDYAVLPEGNRPGVIADYAAIEFNRKAGARYYDFLAGDSQFKRSLSTGTARMEWLVVRRNCLKFRIEDMMRMVRNRLFPRRHRMNRGDSAG